MAVMDKRAPAMQGAEIALCPTCGLSGSTSKELFLANMLGSELPVDFEIYRCSQKHYWRLWDDGTVEPLISELEK